MLIEYENPQNPKIISLFGVYMEGCYDILISKNNDYVYMASIYGLRILPVKSEIVLNISFFNII